MKYAYYPGCSQETTASEYNQSVLAVCRELGIELAEVPDRKSGPSRSLICIVTVCVVFFLSIIASFILNTIKNIKNDPEKLKKLKGIAS